MLFKILQIAIPFVWFGAVAAISFMEAPLKFTAPNITLPLGLGIGMIVFHTLNKIEIGLCLLFAVTLYCARPKARFPGGAFAAIAVILIIQTFALFPLLDERSIKVINGETAPYSGLHIVYIVADSLKVMLLLALGCSTAKNCIKTD